MATCKESWFVNAVEETATAVQALQVVQNVGRTTDVLWLQGTLSYGGTH